MSIIINKNKQTFLVKAREPVNGLTYFFAAFGCHLWNYLPDRNRMA
jgi:hypothetical protein